MVTKTEFVYMGRSARHFLNLISSIFAIFIIIIHSKNIKRISSSIKEYIEKIINTLMIITVVHVAFEPSYFKLPLDRKLFIYFF